MIIILLIVVILNGLNIIRIGLKYDKLDKSLILLGVIVMIVPLIMFAITGSSDGGSYEIL